MAVVKIERIDCYDDPRFSQKLLFQHGCFLADGEPCSFEIISSHEAIIHWQGTAELSERLSELIGEFRFYACHINTFYDSKRRLLAQFPPSKVFSVALRDIQPSQFYVDQEKVKAVGSFILSADDIILPVIRHGERYISLDGHTRLYLAMLNDWQTVNAVEDTSDDSIFDFVAEAQKRHIFTVHDMELVDHSTYEIKWNQFCDEFFS